MAARRDKLGSGRETVQQPGARRDKIEAPSSLGPDPVLDQARRGGKEHVRRDRADQDRVQVGGIDTSLLQHLSCRSGGKVGSGFPVVEDVTLLDPGPGQDPIVSSLDHPFQILIVQDLRRHIAPDPGNLGARRLWLQRG